MGLLKPLRLNALQNIIDTIKDVRGYSIKMYYI